MASETPSVSDNGDRSTIHLTLTLPGSASLGAFQAGAVSALAVVINQLRAAGHPVRVDAIGGASAGSIVGMLFGHAMMTGRDVPSLMRDAWIDGVSIDLLRQGEFGAPLGFDELREELREFVSDSDTAQVHPPLDTPIIIDVGLTSLLGFEIPVVTAGGESSGLSFTDWMTFRLEPGSGIEAVVEPEGSSMLDAVLVSASHPGAFPPRVLQRSHDQAEYEARHIRNFPEDGCLWYIDGGLVESHPISRVLATAQQAFGFSSGIRLHVVVDPRSSGPSGSEKWGQSDGEHSWIDGLRRALSILPTQALHDDLRTVADINERLDRLDEAVDRWAQRDPDRDASEIRTELAEIAGLTSYERVNVELITPLLPAQARSATVSGLLAGDFIGAFGGFLDQGIRRSDYLLGWDSTRQWLDEGLHRQPIDDDTIACIGDEVDRRRPDLGESERSGDGVDQLDWSGRWKLALLAARVGRILVAEALPSLPSKPTMPELPKIPRASGAGNMRRAGS